mgnify:CR=1 FL=1
MALAEKELNIPVLLEVEDFLQGTDERMLATYVSYFRNLIRNNREVRAVFVVRRASGNCVRVVVLVT